MKLFYVLKPIETPLGDSDFVCTVVSKQSEAEEYINMSLKLDNAEHFISWCELRNKDFKSPLSWFEYRRAVKPLNEYKIKCLRYNTKEMAETMRLIRGCMPIGCSFDTKIEKAILLDTLTKVKKS